jgi:hypothetical protein
MDISILLIFYIYFISIFSTVRPINVNLRLLDYILEYSYISY